MPLAGRMKLRTFLLLVGSGVAVLGAIVVGAGFVWGVPALQAQVEEARIKAAERQKEIVARHEATRRALAERRAIDAERRAVQAQQRAERAVANVVQAAPSDSAPVDGPTGGVADAIMVRYLGKPLGTSKRKDVTRGAGYKVNVYQDDGQAVANRAKVDLDRDGQWDEKWSWADGSFSRKVSPDDDERYSVLEVWSNGAWVAR